jgi:hypothetical protein
MKSALLVAAVLLGCSPPVSACTAPHHNDAIPVQLTYDEFAEGYFLISVQYPAEFTGLPVTSVTLSVHDGDLLRLSADIGIDRETMTSGFTIARSFLERTWVSVSYGPREASLCPEYRSIQLHNPQG